MGVLDRRKPYDDLTFAVNFAIDQKLKTIYTAMPGIVESFDANKKRVRVLGAIKQAFIDDKRNTTFSSRTPIVDVPVVFPSAGGYTLSFPLNPGDTVLLVFSMRGIANFKRSFEESNPTLLGILNERDAIAIPGFGPTSYTPASSQGVTLQSDDGSRYVEINDNEIKLVADNVTIEGNVTVDGDLEADNVVAGGIDLKTHKHVYPDPGPPPNQGRTGRPLP